MIAARPGSKGSIYDFEFSLKHFARTVDATLDEVVKQVALALYRGIKEKTPVDTGFARANWQITFGSPAQGTRTAGDYGATDEATIIGAHGLKAVVWVSNNAAYVKQLEYGHSNQAPQGMVRVSVEDLKARLNAIMAKAIKEAGK